jgi:hypothetical protein
MKHLENEIVKLNKIISQLHASSSEKLKKKEEELKHEFAKNIHDLEEKAEKKGLDLQKREADLKHQLEKSKQVPTKHDDSLVKAEKRIEELKIRELDLEKQIANLKEIDLNKAESRMKELEQIVMETEGRLLLVEREKTQMEINVKSLSKRSWMTYVYPLFCVGLAIASHFVMESLKTRFAPK